MTADEKFDLDIHYIGFKNSKIYQAIKDGNHRKSLDAIKSGEDVNYTEDEFGMTYLHLVTVVADTTTEQDYLPMIYQLSNAGINVNAKNYIGETALKTAIEKLLEDIMIALFRVGAEFDQNYKSLIQEHGGPFELQLEMWYGKFEPGLWAAVSSNNLVMVEQLLSYWCRINISKNGQDLLQLSKGNEGKQMTQLLTNNEVIIEFVHATLAGDEPRMQMLLNNNKCDKITMDQSYQKNYLSPVSPRTLKQTASDMGLKHVLHLLPNETDTNDTSTKVEENGGFQVTTSLVCVIL